jgi:hypothetical protein
MEPACPPEAPRDIQPNNSLPLPYEDPANYPSFWSRLSPMFVLAFKSPMDFFERIPRTDGLVAPWTFYLLCSVPIMLIMLLVFAVFGLAFLLQALPHAKSVVPSWVLALIGPLMIVLWIAFSFLGMFLGGAVLHAFLWMWGGIKPGIGLHQTVRAVGYTMGFLTILSLPFTVLSFIPCLGILFSLASFALQMAAAVFLGLGLAKIHRTDTWRGVCAVVVTPIILAGLLLGLALAIAIALAAGAGIHHMPHL